MTVSLEGHFFVARLKETKSNIPSNRLRSQYTGVTLHIKTRNRNVTQLHIFHICFHKYKHYFVTHFASQRDHAGKTAIFSSAVHLPTFNRINSLVRSSVIGVATWAGRGEEVGECSIANGGNGRTMRRVSIAVVWRQTEWGSAVLKIRNKVCR